MANTGPVLLQCPFCRWRLACSEDENRLYSMLAIVKALRAQWRVHLVQRHPEEADPYIPIVVESTPV